MHIVFQVLNFICDPVIEKYQLFPIDKLLLILLSKHHGPKGICPSQDLLAIEAQISSRYVRERIQYLKSVRLISIQKIKRKYHYNFLFLDSIPEPQFLCSKSDSGTTVPKIPEPQFQNSGTTVPPINTDQLNRSVKKETKPKKLVSPPLVLPDWLEKELWESFVQFRKDIKAPMKDKAKKLNLDRLIKFKQQGYDIEEIINTTIMNGWKSFYPPKQDFNQQSSFNHSKPDVRPILETVPEIPKEPQVPQTEEQKKMAQELADAARAIMRKTLNLRR